MKKMKLREVQWLTQNYFVVSSCVEFEPRSVSLKTYIFFPQMVLPLQAEEDLSQNVDVSILVQDLSRAEHLRAIGIVSASSLAGITLRGYRQDGDQGE